MEEFYKRLRTPGNAARPVQIIHHYYPKTAAEQEAFLDDAVSKGMGGFCLNMDMPGELDLYLAEDTAAAQEEWQALRCFVDGCFARELCVWIYDERLFPSGAAGNCVLKKMPDAQVKGLILDSELITGDTGVLKRDERALRHAAAYPVVNGRLLLNESVLPDIGEEKITFHVPADGRKYRMCAVYTGPVLFITQNGVPYTDLLRADVVDAFLSVTHERYLKYLGAERIAKIIAFFTDEPGLPVHGCAQVFDERGAVAAWTEGVEALLPEKFEEKYISLFFDTNADDAAFRAIYWSAIGKLFEENYFGRIGAWCERHGTRLTGHMYGEETLSMQIGLNAGLFALMRHMQMPGVDRLYCLNPRDVTAEKTASSCMHLCGREMTMSENSFHLEMNFWDAQDQTTNENRLNSWYYQAQLGITNAASYFTYDGDADRKSYEEKSGRVSEFIRTGSHQTDVLVLIPMCSAVERYKAPFEKYWLVGPCTVAPGQSADMRCLEAAYGETLYQLQEEYFDCDLIDDRGLLACRVEDGALMTDYERFTQLVVFDAAEWEQEILAKIHTFLKVGGHLSIVQVDEQSTTAKSLYEGYPGQITFCCAEDISENLPAARRLVFADTEKGIRVRKSEYKGHTLLFIHNRTDAEKIVCLEKTLWRVFDTAGNEFCFEGGKMTVAAQDALMAIRKK